MAPDGGQQAIDGSSAHGEDALADLGVEVEVAVPLQGCDQAGQEGLQAFTTDAVGGFPEDDQGLSHRLVVGAPGHDGGVGSEGAIRGEQPDGVLAVAASDGDELVEDLALVVLGGSLIPLPQHFEQLVLGLLADLLRHGLPPELGNILLRQ
jgi:hypothetical protein